MEARPASPGVRAADLAGISLFEAATEPDLDLLSANARRRSFRRGEVIYYQGDAPLDFFALLSGVVKIELLAPDGRRLTIGWLEAGSVLGTMSLVDSCPREESAIAHEACEVIALDLQDMRAFIERNQKASAQLLQLIAARWRTMHGLLYELAFLDVAGRIAKLLLNSARNRTVTDEAAISSLTQPELASLVGATRESVNKCLHSFEREGLIELDHGRIRVLQPQALRRRLS